MKKALIFLLCVSLFLCCGCTGYREIERGYFVTAIGFTKQGRNFNIILETLSPSDVQPSGETSHVLSGSGKTLDAAYDEINKSLIKKLYFEHCGVIVFNQNFTEDELSEIFDFCSTFKTLNIDAFAVKSDDVKLLFETEAADESVGYDIIGLVKNAGDNVFSNQLYQIERQRKRGISTILPTVSAKNNTLILE